MDCLERIINFINISVSYKKVNKLHRYNYLLHSLALFECGLLREFLLSSATLHS